MQRVSWVFHPEICVRRRVGHAYLIRAGDGSEMAQPHKGDRAQIMCRPVLPVYEEIRRRASARGMSMSQYAADVLAEHVGRPDLVRELAAREGLPLAM